MFVTLQTPLILRCYHQNMSGFQSKLAAEGISGRGAVRFPAVALSGASYTGSMYRGRSFATLPSLFF